MFTLVGLWDYIEMGPEMVLWDGVILYERARCRFEVILLGHVNSVRSGFCASVWFVPTFVRRIRTTLKDTHGYTCLLHGVSYGLRYHLRRLRRYVLEDFGRTRPGYCVCRLA